MRQWGIWISVVLLWVSCAPEVEESVLLNAEAEYGILADMDGDGTEEWLLVYFAGTDEIIDRYTLALYTQKDGAWGRTDSIESSDPALPEYFRELTPDLPPNPENLPESLVHFPYPRGEGWTGGPLSVWYREPAVALPVADIDGKPGLEVLVPLTGFEEWRVLFLGLRGGDLTVIGDIEGLEFAAEVGGRPVWAGRKTGGAELGESETQRYTEYNLDANGLLAKVEPLSAPVQAALFQWKVEKLTRLGTAQALRELAWFHRLYRGIPTTAQVAEWGARVPGLEPNTLAALEGELKEF